MAVKNEFFAGLFSFFHGLQYTGGLIALKPYPVKFECFKLFTILLIKKRYFYEKINYFSVDPRDGSNVRCKCTKDHFWVP
jgi:hypothetical protein